MEVEIVQARPDFDLIDNHEMGDFDSGSISDCVCPICGFKIPKEDGVPCYNRNCPRCGMLLTKTKC
jgi:hypothetical protein